MSINKVIEEDLTQVFEGTIGLLFESAVAVERRLRIKVGRAQFFNFTNARLKDFLVMCLRFDSAVYLALHALLLIDKEHNYMEVRLLEMLRVECLFKFITLFDQLLIKELNALHLYFSAGETIDDCTALINGVKEFAQHDLDDLTVAH